MPLLENPHISSKTYEKHLRNLPSTVQREFLDLHPLGLTIYQQFAIPIVRWLLFGQRASGRTEVIAHVIIQEAIATGRAIPVLDHHRSVHEIRTVQGRISDLLQTKYSEYDYTIRHTDNTVAVWKRRHVLHPKPGQL